MYTNDASCTCTYDLTYTPNAVQNNIFRLNRRAHYVYAHASKYILPAALRMLSLVQR